MESQKPIPKFVNLKRNDFINAMNRCMEPSEILQYLTEVLRDACIEYRAAGIVAIYKPDETAHGVLIGNLNNATSALASVLVHDSDAAQCVSLANQYASSHIAAKIAIKNPG